VGKAQRPHHRSAIVQGMVGTLRFAHPTKLRRTSASSARSPMHYRHTKS
jgi:hypothetical protein